MTDTSRVDRFLRLMSDRGASDLHISVGRPPMLRVGGQLEPIQYRVLTNEDFVSLLKPICTVDLWQEFKELGDADLAWAVAGVGRFRVNLLMQQRGYAAVFRSIPETVLSFGQLGLPPQISRFCFATRGLVLVTGPTGSGKSTSLASVVDRINEEQSLHIITIEDPIEFVHPNKKSIVSQREVGQHANSFAEAIRAAVREDPDVILLGEMRDLETIRAALAAAEGGFMVFATLHTNNAAKAVDRIISVFPDDEQERVRSVLAQCLRGVLAQQLVPRAGGGRVAALEVLFGSQGVSTMIRDGKTSLITSAIQMGKSEGMLTMDDSLLSLVRSGVIEASAAYDKAIDKSEMRKKLGLLADSLESTLS